MSGTSIIAQIFVPLKVKLEFTLVLLNTELTIVLLNLFLKTLISRFLSEATESTLFYTN